jgi:hypothetical protein
LITRAFGLDGRGRGTGRRREDNSDQDRQSMQSRR